MINKATLFLRKRLELSIVRYFIMAGFVVCIELAIFVALNSVLKINYQAATALSALLAILLNWYFSRTLVFKYARHRLHIEALLIFSTSLIGIGIQTTVATICVGALGLIPVLGKFIAILITAIWSFWVRKRFIFTN